MSNIKRHLTPKPEIAKLFQRKNKLIKLKKKYIYINDKKEKKNHLKSETGYIKLNKNQFCSRRKRKMVWLKENKINVIVINISLK